MISTQWTTTDLKPRAMIVTGDPTPSKITIDRTIKDMFKTHEPSVTDEGWTKEEFLADLKRASANGRLKEAIREAREDYREGRVEPFPER